LKSVKRQRFNSKHLPRRKDGPNTVHLRSVRRQRNDQTTFLAIPTGSGQNGSRAGLGRTKIIRDLLASLWSFTISPTSGPNSYPLLHYHSSRRGGHGQSGLKVHNALLALRKYVSDTNTNRRATRSSMKLCSFPLQLLCYRWRNLSADNQHSLRSMHECSSRFSQKIFWSSTQFYLPGGRDCDL
jgi:hypothetical protein